MGFKSILSGIDKELKAFFEKVAPVGEEILTIAKDAEPFIDAVLPGIGTLYNATVSEVIKAEGLAIAAGEQNGTGPQKLAAVVAAITPTVLAYATANGLPTPDSTHITAMVNGVVASLNALPAAV